ncbi:hypothetical protein [Yeosuana marina]|uniref:hypothetical protein n=1 Tax=Yeosuana marina TaxID=1565536 RepID=UPI001422492C|nr:hypothetical protein [Yeosuana marina]
MFDLNKFSISRVALPLATLLALFTSLVFYFIMGRHPVLLQGFLVIYIIFGSIRTFFAYKNEGGLLRLIKDLIIGTLAILALFFMGICIGWLAC